MHYRKSRAGLTEQTVITLRGLASRAGRYASVVAFASIAAAVFARPADAAGIVPDGGTATAVTTSGNGRQTVSIAPAVFGVSNNTYTNFNVGKAGVALDNTSINARTIVNQVTGTNPSLIEGQIAVLGSRANVVLANPNGITVNGGSFVNTGHVALTTGQVGFSDVQLASGQFQRNVVLSTQGGTITVGPGGLAGTLIGLDLIAKNVQLNGPVTNRFSSATAYVRAVAGTSQVTLNTGISPDDNGNDWLSLANSQIANPNAIAIDIEPTGSITAGSIRLIATDLGAGVRTAGTLVANAGDFTLSAAGDVQLLQGSSTSAANNVTAQTSGAFSLTGASLQAGAALSISSNGFTSTNVGTTESVISSASSGVLIRSIGDITNISSLIQGNKRISNDSASVGAVTLIAGGNVTNSSDTTQPGTLGVVFGSGDDVSITASGNVINRNARIESNDNVTIGAQGDIDNIIDHTPGANGGQLTSYSDHGHRWLFLTANDDGFSIDYGALPAPTQQSYIFADSGNVTLSGRNVNNVGGNVLSNGGNVAIAAQEQMVNQAVFTGQASFSQHCFIFCHESAWTTIQSFGGQIEASGDIAITAGTQASNIGGNVYAQNGNLTITAPTVTAQGVMGYTAYNRNIGLKAWFGNNWATIYASDDGGLFAAASGQVALVGQGVINGGIFSGAKGVRATNGIVTIAPPYHQPVTIGSHNHLGLVSWFGL
jgi:filamentous hemagglutinin family protein